MSSLAVGIDLGTSGARAVAVDEAGAIVAHGAARLDAFGPDHRDPAAWASAVDAALGGVMAAVDPASVRAIAVDGTSGTMIAVDGAGRPVAPPLMYNDPVTDQAVLKRITSHAPEESAAHGPTSGLAKAIVLARAPEAVRIIHQADWIAGRLTGRFDLSDENNALKTGYDPVSRRWPSWIAATGLPDGLLPDVMEPGATMGVAGPDAVKRHGLAPGTLVVAGTTDGCASFLATGAAEPGDGVTALGTTLTVKLFSDRPVFAPRYGIYSHRIGDRWLAGGASNTGGNALAAFFTPGEIERLSPMIDPGMPSGLDYYPLVRPGERFPINDPDLQPRLHPRPADDVLFLQGLLEGIAGVEALAYRRLAELGAPALSSVRTVGGGARNDVWTGIRERCLGVPSRSVLSSEAAYGTALLARTPIAAGAAA